MKPLLAAAAGLAALAYPLLAHGAAALDSGSLALAAAALLLVLALLPALRRGAPLAWLALAAITTLLAWLFHRGQALLPLYAAPVLLNLLAARLFGRSLRRGRTPLVERIARLLHGAPLPPDVVRYTRRVTLGWTVLLLGLALLNAVLALLASPDGLLEAAGLVPPVAVPRSVWSLFANLINYLVLALAFVGEFLWRRRRFPEHASGGLAAFVAGVARLGPGFWRAS